MEFNLEVSAKDGKVALILYKNNIQSKSLSKYIRKKGLKR